MLNLYLKYKIHYVFCILITLKNVFCIWMSDTFIESILYFLLNIVSFVFYTVLVPTYIYTLLLQAKIHPFHKSFWLLLSPFTTFGTFVNFLCYFLIFLFFFIDLLFWLCMLCIVILYITCCTYSFTLTFIKNIIRFTQTQLILTYAKVSQ